jgi:hypothetical protein
MRNRNSNNLVLEVLAESKSENKTGENSNEEDDNLALATMIEDINTNINNEQEKKGFCEISPQILYTLE